MGNTDIRNLKGENGGDYLSGAGTLTPSALFSYYDCILVLSATVATLVSTNITGTLTAVALPAGLPIYGKFTSVTLASGAVIAYNKT